MNVYQVLGQLGSGTAGDSDSVSGIRKGKVGVEACSRPDLELCKAVTAEDVCDAWLSVRCCAACHRSKALRSRGTHFRHEVPVVVDAGPGDVMIAPAGHSAASSFPDRLLRHVDEFRAASQSGRAVSLPTPMLEYPPGPERYNLRERPLLDPSEEKLVTGLRDFLDDWPFEFLTPDSEVRREVRFLPMRADCYLALNAEEVPSDCVIVVEATEEHYLQKCAAAICTHEEWARAQGYGVT
jgi:hypothetical protein